MLLPSLSISSCLQPHDHPQHPTSSHLGLENGFDLLVINMQHGSTTARRGDTTGVLFMQETAVIATIEDFMWLKLHMVQPSASSSTANSSPNSASHLLSPSYTMAALQEQVLHWGPNFFSQNGTQPLVYVVVLLMSQHFGHAVQYMGSQTDLKDHGVHLAIACNHLKVGSPSHPPPPSTSLSEQTVADRRDSACGHLLRML